MCYTLTMSWHLFQDYPFTQYKSRLKRHNLCATNNTNNTINQPQPVHTELRCSSDTMMHWTHVTFILVWVTQFCHLFSKFTIFYVYSSLLIYFQKQNIETKSSPLQTGNIHFYQHCTFNPWRSQFVFYLIDNKPMIDASFCNDTLDHPRLLTRRWLEALSKDDTDDSLNHPNVFSSRYAICWSRVHVNIGVSAADITATGNSVYSHQLIKTRPACSMLCTYT